MQDAAADAALKAVVRDIAGQLGVRADALDIRFDGEAERRGVGGLANGRVIHLRADTFEPATGLGRRLLAHEMAHVAQSLLPHAASQPLQRVRIPAEIEAEMFARDYAARGTGAPVRVPAPVAMFADKDFDALLGTVLKSRAAEIAAIVDLLSYGPFDWRVSDDDVFDALQIFTSFPLMTARAMAVAIGAIYRERLFANLNAPHYANHRAEILAVCWAVRGEHEFAAADYRILARLNLEKLDPLETAAVDAVAAKSPKMIAAADAKQKVRIGEARAFAVDSEAQKAVADDLAEAHKTEEKRAADEAKTDVSINDVSDRIKAKLAELIVRDAEALELLDAVADACLTVTDPAGKFQAIANRIGGTRLDELIDQIPVKGLYASERRRRAFIYLVATRSAYRNAKLADDLLSSPWWKLWDTVTSEEAYLAFLLVRAMPARGRAAFLKARGGDKWADVLAELPGNIRESAAFNFYEGGEGQADRQALLIELGDPALWTRKGHDRLEALARLAEAAGEGAYLFALSKRFRADAAAGLGDLVTAHKWYVEKTRESHAETALEGHAWYQEGIFGKLGRIGDFLALLFGIRNLQLFGDKYAADLDLSSLGEAGPGFSQGGARFRQTSEAQKKEDRKSRTLPSNTIRVTKQDRGAITLDARQIALERIAIGGETRVNAGPVTIDGLSFSVVYDPKTKVPLNLVASFGAVEIADCTIASPGGLYGINRFYMSGVHLVLSNEAFADTETQSGLGAMFKVLVAPRRATGVQLAFELLRMLGLATSSGTFVEAIEVDGLTIHSGGNAVAYREALKGSERQLERRIAGEEKAVTAAPDQAGPHNDRIARLRRQLGKVQADLKAPPAGGAVIDIGSIRVRGLPGGDGEPIELHDIHGQGRSVAAVVPLFADPSAIEQLVRGRDAVRTPTVAGRVPANAEPFEIDIGSIERKTPLRLVGAIPTPEKAAEDFADFIKANGARRFDPAYEPVAEALRERMTQARDYAALAAKGVQNLRTTRIGTETVDEATRFRNLRAALIAFEERRATIVDSFRLEGVTLDTGSGGTPELAVESLSVGTIRTFAADGSAALSIGAISGKAVHLGASIAGGIAKAKDWRTTLQGVDVRARSLTLSDIRHVGSGAIIEELSFESDGVADGLDVSFRRGNKANGGASVGIKSHRIRARGVSVPAYAALLRAERDRIVGIDKLERSPDEAKRLATIAAMLDDLARIEEKRAAAEQAGGMAKTPRARKTAEQQRANSEQALQDWQDRLLVERLTIDKLDLAIGGLGDVFGKNYDFGRDAAGLKVGAGASKHWVDRVAFEGIRHRGAKGDQTVADRIVIGPIGGGVEKTKTGWKLSGFTVGEIAARGLSYAAGTKTVTSVGESRLLGIAIDAEVTIAKGRTDLKLTHARIERIVAERLRYEDADKVVTVTTGELIGIDLSGMQIGLPEGEGAKATIDGGVTIDAVKSLSLNAVTGGYAVDATLDAPRPRQAEAHALSVHFAKSGEMTVSLEGLSARASMTQPGTANKVLVTWKNLGGTVVANGDEYAIRGLTVEDLTLSHLDWSVDGKRIQINDRVTLQGIALDVEASLRPKPAKPGAKPQLDAEGEKKPPEKELAKLLVKRFAVRTIDAKDVIVTIPAVEAGEKVDYAPRKMLHLGAATIEGLKVTGFDVLAKAGKIEIGKSVKVSGLQAEIGEAVRHDLKRATLSLSIFGKDTDEPKKGGRELSATINARDGTTTLQLGRTDSLALSDILAMGEKDPKRGKDASETKADRISLAGITTGALVIKEDMVSISDIDIAGPIGIANVDWRTTGLSKQHITMESATIPQPMRIGRVAANFRKVPTGKIVGGEEEKRSELSSVEVTGVTIPEIAATKLHYQGPTEDDIGAITGSATVDMPLASIKGITLTRFEKNFVTNLTTLNAKIASATVRGFAVTLAETVGKATKSKTFGADLDVGEMRANTILRTSNRGQPDEKTAIESGGFELDSLSLRRITGQLRESGSKDRTIGFDTRFAGQLANAKQGPGLDVTGIKIDKDGKRLGGASLRGLVFRDPNMGLTLDIQELMVPQETVIPNQGAMTIPRANITNAFFQIDDLGALGGSGGEAGAGAGGGVDTEQFYGILDHVNGKIAANAHVPIYLASSDLLGVDAYLRQDVFRIDVDVTNGKFNYRDAWKNAAWARNRAVAGLGLDTDAVTTVPTADGEMFVPDWSESYLTLSAAGYNIIEWHPGDAAEREEMTRETVRLKRLIRPTDTSTEEEKRKKKITEEWHKREHVHEKQHVDPSQIVLDDIHSSIGISGYIPLNLGPTGRIALGTKGGNVLTALALNSVDAANLAWTLEQMAVTVEELHFGKTTLKGGKAGGAEFQIGAIEDGVLQFAGGKVMNPKKLSGTVTKASVTNLAIDPGS